MDIQECVADNDRYAFLLGSALRNADSEQFFCIYDSIIPKELSDVQVEKIKEKARSIAELPEDEFNQLVLSARDYSLARGRPPSSPALAMNTSGHDVVSDHSDDEEENIFLYSDLSQQHLAANASSHKSNAAGMTDDDSGLPSSTKTGHCASVSSEDSADVEEPLKVIPPCADMLHHRGEEKEEEREVSIPKERELVMVSHCYNPQYDEVVMVDNDCESLESPRSDASSTREYDVTKLEGDYSAFSFPEMPPYSTVQHSSESQEDSVETIHKSLYGRHSFGGSGNSCEHPRAPSISAINFARSSNILAKGETISSLRGSSSGIKTSSVDASVNFSLGSPSTQSPYSPDSSALLQSHVSPPFGTGENLLCNIGNSVCSLVNSSSDLQGATSTYSENAQGDRKKKKKKKENKDDGTQESGLGSKAVDLNGNPIELDDSHSMRDHSGDSHSLVSGSRDSGSSGTLHHDASGSKGHSLEMGHKGEDIGPGSSGHGKRKNKRKPGIEVHPEKDEGYVGDIKSIDDLVRYINNECSQQDIKKMGQSPGDSSKNKKVPAGGAQLKVSKKNRHKNKGQESAGDKVETSQSPEPAVGLTDLSHPAIPSPVGEQSCQDFVKDFLVESRKTMGNSSSYEKPGGEEEDKPLHTETVANSTPSVLTAKTTSPSSTSGLTAKTTPPSSTSGVKKTDNHVMRNTTKSAKQKQGDASQERQKQDSNAKDKDKNSGKVIDKFINDANHYSKKSKSRPQKKESLKTSPGPATPEIPAEVPSSVQEQWCTVVSNTKKKRRRSPSKLQGQNISKPKNMSEQAPSCDVPVSNSKHYTEVSIRNVASDMSHQSATPSLPSSTQPYVKPAWNSSGAQRDLSPTDFPTLNNKSPRDCQNAVEQFDSDKDSDKESCRSDKKRLGNGGRTVYPVSYATMASSKVSHESADSSKAESVSSSMEDANLEDFSADTTSTMKWKGTHHERRHSIGSAPEDLSKTNACGSLQRTGSQEMLPRDKALENVGNSMAVAGVKCFSQGDSTASFSGSEADSARGSEVGSEAAVEEFQPASITLTPSNVRMQVTAGDKAAVASDVEDAKAVIPSTEAGSHPTTSTNETESSPSLVKQGTSGSREKVVFFDSHKDMHPVKGLKFGFFSDAERASIVNSIIDKQSVPPATPSSKDNSFKINSSASLTSFIGTMSSDSESVTPSAGSVSSTGASCSPVPPPVIVSSSVHKGSLASAPLDASCVSTGPPTAVRSSDVHSKAQKGTHIARLNGFVSTQASPTSPSTSQASPQSTAIPSMTQGQDKAVCGGAEGQKSEGLSVPQGSSSSILTVNKTPETNLSGESVGDSPASISFTYGPSQNGECKSCVFLYPPNQLPGRKPSQDIINKAYFLQSSWEKTYNLYRTGKDPQIVAYWDLPNPQHS